MGIVRNMINIEGITTEENLPDKISQQLIQYSEVDYIFIPDNKPEIDNIYQIGVSIEIRGNRIINNSINKIAVIDGIKKFKIMCTEKKEKDKAIILDLEVPYNTFLEIPQNQIEAININVYIVDAFFQLIGSRQIYSHMVYEIDGSHRLNIDNLHKSSLLEDDIFDFTEEIKVEHEVSSEIVLSKTEDRNDALLDIDAEYL